MDENLVEEIKNDLKLALLKFKDNDSKSFDMNDSERAKVFRIGYYLQGIIESKYIYKKDKIVVDCEYNRMINQDGRIAKFMKCMKDDNHNGNIIPDLIVHHRNSHECNLLVCEFKNKNANDRDERKLKEFKKSKFFHYALSCFINLEKLCYDDNLEECIIWY